MKSKLLLASLLVGAATVASAQDVETSVATFNINEIGASLTWPEDDNVIYIDGETYTDNGVEMYFEKIEGSDTMNKAPSLYKVSTGCRVRIYPDSFMRITAPEGYEIQSVGLYSDLSLSGAGFASRATVEGYERVAATEWPDGLTFSSGSVWTPEAGSAPEEFLLENNATSGMVSFVYAKIVTAKKTETGIAGVNSDVDAPVEYFNLSGLRVSEPTDGLYIRRQGSKVSKVIIK